MGQMHFAAIGLCCIPLLLSGQSVIINEISQGSSGGKEWVELLVVEDGVDLRGWDLGDNDDGIWHPIAEFSNHGDWMHVQSGTFIVIYNSGDVDETITLAGGEDTVFSDKSVLIPINNSRYIVDRGPWGSTSGAFANSDRDDCPAIRNLGDIIIHDMAQTHGTATVPSPGSAKVKYYTGNTASGTADNSNWVVAASSEATPGIANGGANSNWVDSSLPVELSTWSASSQGVQVILTWTTESEVENLGFIIERRRDDRGEPAGRWLERDTFLSCGELNGQGSTSSGHAYTYTDIDVEPGQTYSYRLSDVDYQGVVTRHPALQITVQTDGSGLKPEALLLQPASPNPFNSRTKLSFDLAQSTVMALQVYDLQGRLVETLQQGVVESGQHTQVWDAGNLASGIYVIRLRSGAAVQLQRVTLIR